MKIIDCIERNIFKKHNKITGIDTGQMTEQIKNLLIIKSWDNPNKNIEELLTEA